MARRKVYDQMPIARGFGKGNAFNRLVSCFECGKSFEAMQSPNVYMRRGRIPPEILCQSCFEATGETAVDITKGKIVVAEDDT